MIAVGLVAFSFSSIFVIYSAALRMIRAQQETLSATLYLQERFDRIRSGNWLEITVADRLEAALSRSTPAAAGSLRVLEEDVTVTPYPLPATAPTPIRLRRALDGTFQVLSQPAVAIASSAVRVDVRLSWRGQNRTRVREGTAIVALGGILR